MLQYPQKVQGNGGTDTSEGWVLKTRKRRKKKKYWLPAVFTAIGLPPWNLAKTQSESLQKFSRLGHTRHHGELGSQLGNSRTKWAQGQGIVRSHSLLPAISSQKFSSQTNTGVYLLGNATRPRLKYAAYPKYSKAINCAKGRRKL